MLSVRNWANERIFDLRAAIIFIVSKSNAASEFGVSHNAAALFLDPPNASFANKINADVRFGESLFLYRKCDGGGEPYDIGFTLRTREGFDMYMMIQNSSGVSLLCHTDESMKYGIQAFNAVKRVGLTNAGSAAIVIDFTVESPLLAKQALDIMRTEPLDLPDNLLKGWEELSSLKDVIIANMNKQKKN